MDIFNKVGAKFRHKSTLVTDAVPSPARGNGERTPPSRSEVNIEEVSDNNTCEGDASSPIVTDPTDSPPVPPRRKKNKQKDKASENKLPDFDDIPKPPPINTQATGSVINIVNSKGVHVGPDITYHIGSPGKTESNKEPKTEQNVKKTKTIVAVMESKDKITHEHMDIVSKNLGSGWRSVARKLGFEDPMLDLFYETHQHKGIPEVIYQILLDWTRTGRRTLGELATQLWKEDKRVAVRQLADLSVTQSKQKDLD